MRVLDLFGGAEIISEEHCWELLATQSVGRIATTAQDRINIFPVNYRLAGHDIAWSVVVHGQATIDALATDNDEEPSWTGPKSYLVRITASSVSGRAIR